MSKCTELYTLSTGKQRRNFAFNNMEKLCFIERIEKGTKSSKISKELNIPKSTVCTWVKNKERIRAAVEAGNVNGFRKRSTKCDELDAALLDWFKQMSSLGVVVNGKVLYEKAQELAEVLNTNSVSKSWIDRFRHRHNIQGSAKCAVMTSTDVMCVPGRINDSQEAATETDWKTRVLPNLLRYYSPVDIFTIGETQLSCKVNSDDAGFIKNELDDKLEGDDGKIVIALTANMLGTEKLSLLVIGKSPKAQCLQNVVSLPIDYYQDSNAAMTAKTFTSWLKNVDSMMVQQKRRIALITGKSITHPKVDGLKAVRLYFLPSNYTAELQPMDQGITELFSYHYRKQLLRLILENSEKSKQKHTTAVEVLQAVRLALTAWSMVSSESIANCFSQAFDGSSTCESSLISPTEVQSMQLLIESVDSNCEMSCENMEGNTPETKPDISPTTSSVGSDADVSQQEVRVEADVVTPSHAIALQCVETLKRYFESRSDSNDIQLSLYDMERSILVDQQNGLVLTTSLQDLE